MRKNIVSRSDIILDIICNNYVFDLIAVTIALGLTITFVPVMRHFLTNGDYEALLISFVSLTLTLLAVGMSWMFYRQDFTGSAQE